jgi:hypothetical protein
VLTPADSGIGVTPQWLADKLDDEYLMVDTEGVVSVYNSQTLAGAGHWTKEDYERLHQRVVEGFAGGQALMFRDISKKTKDFITSINTQRPLLPWARNVEWTILDS